LARVSGETPTSQGAPKAETAYNYKMDIVDRLNDGGVGLLPTDTIYGLSCFAFDGKAVERVYDIKGRDRKIPVIVLISDISDLKSFRIALDTDTEKLLSENRPGKISFILPIEKGFEYLTRGSQGLAFRLPDDDKLRSLIRKTGPLVSTSANPSGGKPATNAKEARGYFGNKLDFYQDAGELISLPSTLVDLTGKFAVVIRQGETPFMVRNI